MGKATDWAKNKLGPLAPRPFWAPDFKIMINAADAEGDMGVAPTMVLCEVELKGRIKWNPDAFEKAGIKSAREADEAVQKFRRGQK